jgi:apolipoprotein N-acyltransferase
MHFLSKMRWRLVFLLVSGVAVASVVRLPHLYPLAWVALVPALVAVPLWMPRVAGPGKWLISIVGVASVWTCGEWLLAKLFNLETLHFGYSQQPYHSVCQVADLGGVYAVSFLVVLGNAAIAAGIVDALRAREGEAISRSALPQLLVGLLLVLATTYGSWQIDDIAPLRDGPPPNAILNGATTALRVFVELPERDKGRRDLAPRAIRCIERRIPLVARWADGNVLLIDSRGRIKGPFEADDPVVTSKPLKLDARRTIYDRVGDAFAWGCTAAAITFVACGFTTSARLSRRAASLSRRGARPAAHSSVTP